MKKFALLFCLLLVIPFISACGNNGTITFQTRLYNANALDYGVEVRNNFVLFKELTKNYVHSIDNQTFAQQNVSYKILQTALNNNYMILPAYDCCLNSLQKPISPNLSNFAFTLSDIGLNSYDLTRVNSEISGTSETFKLKISGLDPNNAQLLPTVSQSSSTYLDALDGKILGMGNYMYFKVDYVSNSSSSLKSYYKVTVATQFDYPTAKEIPAGTYEDVKYVRDDAAKKITMVYQLSGVIYSKVISFVNGEKTVIKYRGDTTLTNNTPAIVGNYSYKMSTVEVLGSYDVKYESATGYLYIKHSYPNTETISGKYTVFESYILNSDITIYRVSNVASVNSSTKTVVDLYVSSSCSSGNLKNSQRTESLEYLSDFNSLSTTTFAKITEADKNNTALKKVAFAYADGNILCETVGY